MWDKVKISSLLTVLLILSDCFIDGHYLKVVDLYLAGMVFLHHIVRLSITLNGALSEKF